MSWLFHLPWWLNLFLVVVLLGLANVLIRARRCGRTRLITSTAKSVESERSGKKVIYYRTKEGLADYGFLFDQRPDGYRIYIIQQPSYEGRADDSHTAHRLHDGHGAYICWNGKLETESQARHVAARWADGTQSYIRFGIPF